ncbi:glycerol kinase GlpK [Alphaproteobacteria bacterium]|nr:glycerol kinase GlpK [Alphaproteobacteria bacterium]
MKNYIISIDQGTTSSRVVLYDKNFSIFDSVHKELKQYFPKNGWVEHDPMQIWNDVNLLIFKILKKNKIKSSQILSIGIANQRETTVLWDKKNGKPVYNAIVWQDRRTKKNCDQLKKKKLDKKIQNITGLVIDPYFSATKINWIIKNIKKTKVILKNKNLLFGTIDTWLLWKLTEGKSHFTDITNASRTMLFDSKKEKWSNTLLKIFNVPIEILPQVKPNVYNFGVTNLYGKAIKIGGMAGDQQAATIGQACFEKGQSKSTYGTGCFLLMNIGKEFKLSKNKLLTTVAYKVGKQKMYCFEGSIFVAGSAIQWLRDKMKFFKNSKETDNIYNKAKNNNEVIFVPALTGLGAPHWCPDVRGTLFGINRGTSISEIVKATLDSLGFQTLELIEGMEKDSKVKINEIKVDGGMVNNENFIQSLSNILQIKIITPFNLETTSLGVAYLAGLSIGNIKNLKSIKKNWQLNKSYLPKITKKINSKKIKKWKSTINLLIKYYS